MKKRSRNALIGSTAIFTIAAISGALLLANNEQVKNVEAAGTTFNAGTVIYLAANGDIDISGCHLNAWVHYGSGSHWEEFTYDALSGYYMITLDSSASSLTFARTSNGSDGGTDWNDVGSVYNQRDMSFESGKNWLYPKNWNDSITLEWRFITYHVAGTFNSWSGIDSAYKMNDGADDSNQHQASFIITTTDDNAEFKCTANYNGTVPGSNWYGDLESGYDTKYIGTNSGNIVLKVAGTYEIYLKSSRKIWAQISSSTEAEVYATEFLSTITCTTNSTTFDISKWNTVGTATTSMEYKFGKLTTGAQNVLKGATGSEIGTVVEQAIARYDRILSKYGYGTAAGQYHDFMNRTPAVLSSPRILSEDGINSVENAAAIFTIAFVSVTAGCGYFFIRKKKEL